jgi:antirestriction protein ArdC
MVAKDNDERTIGMCGNATRPRRTTRKFVNSAQRFQRGGINAFYPTCLDWIFAAHAVAVQKHFAWVAANHHRGAMGIARDNTVISSLKSSECARGYLLAPWSCVFCWPGTRPVTGSGRRLAH